MLALTVSECFKTREWFSLNYRAFHQQDIVGVLPGRSSADSILRLQYITVSQPSMSPTNCQRNNIGRFLPSLFNYVSMKRSQRSAVG